MMEHGRVDDIQKESYAIYKLANTTHIVMSDLGKDRPDHLVGRNDGYMQENTLIEYKTVGEHPTDGQIEFARKWTGTPIYLVYTKDELKVLLGLKKGKPPMLLRDYPTKVERGHGKRKA